MDCTLKPFLLGIGHWLLLNFTVIMVVCDISSPISYSTTTINSVIKFGDVCVGYYSLDECHLVITWILLVLVLARMSSTWCLFQNLKIFQKGARCSAHFDCFFRIIYFLQHGTTQHSTAVTTVHSTTQHSTAQHSTAQHSTAQHSTAQHNTAQHSREHVGVEYKLSELKGEV